MVCDFADCSVPVDRTRNGSDNVYVGTMKNHSGMFHFCPDCMEKLQVKAQELAEMLPAHCAGYVGLGFLLSPDYKAFNKLKMQLDDAIERVKSERRSQKRFRKKYEEDNEEITPEMEKKMAARLFSLKSQRKFLKAAVLGAGKRFRP